VTAREQTSDGEFNRLILPYDNFTNLLREGVNVVGHPEIICGNAALRKQDMRKMDACFCYSCSNNRSENLRLLVCLYFRVRFRALLTQAARPTGPMIEIVRNPYAHRQFNYVKGLKRD